MINKDLTNRKTRKLFLGILSLFVILAMAFLAAGAVMAQVPTPFLVAFPEWETVEGYGYPLGENVRLEIDDPTTAEVQPDYSTNGTVVETGWGGNYVKFKLWGEDGYDLKPGDLVSLIYNDETLTHRVRNLSITDVDVEADIVTGTADPGEVVHANTYDDWGVVITTTTSSGGEWIFNTGLVLEYSSGGRAQIYDEFGNSTAVDWATPALNSFVAVSITQHWFMLDQFPANVPVTISVYEHQGDMEPVLVLDRYSTNESGFLSIEGWMHNWDLEPGNYVIASGGDVTKELVLEYITLDAFDPANDFISGHALPGREVSVGVGNETGEQWMNVFADAITGEWNADFTGTGFDITEDMWAGGHVGDEDGDVTAAHNSGPPEPPAWFTAFPAQDVVEGWNWPLSANIHLTIDDPATTEISPDYEQEETVAFTPWGSSDLWVWFEFGDEYDLKPGDVVTLTDGTTERTHTVRNLSITSIASEQNTVIGTSDASESIYLWSWEDPQGLRVQTTANNMGVWRADFDDVGFDLLPGFHVRAEVWDENGNDTAADLYVHPTYTGLWRTVDSYDQSNMQMTISGGGNNQYQLTWTDDYWSSCNGRSVGHGIGTPDLGGGLLVDWVIECRGDVVWEGQINYFMDIAAGTLSDGANTWYLVGNR